MSARPRKPIAQHPCFDPAWARSPRGLFYRLVHLDPEAEGLSGIGGVLVVWHDGVRPEWVYVSAAADLAAAIHALADNADVMSYEVNGGLFVTWALLRSEHRDGAVAYLADRLRPAVRAKGHPSASVPVIAITPPGESHPARGRIRFP